MREYLEKILRGNKEWADAPIPADVVSGLSDGLPTNNGKDDSK